MKLSILVVDDEPMTRHMLRVMLELEGYQITEAVDGLDALKKIEQEQPDALILDVMMPKMDGITVCEKLRQDPKTRDLPIIMLSGRSHHEAVARGLKAGANKYMGKPMLREDLLAGLREVLGRFSVLTSPVIQTRPL